MSKDILIIEDEPNIVESLTFLLKRSGYSVTAESDGANAADRIRADSPDLVILDVMLPNRSGFDILRDIQPLSHRPKVLMLTAKGQTKDRHLAENIGVDQFMTKPFSNVEIVETVKKLLS